MQNSYIDKIVCTLKFPNLKKKKKKLIIFEFSEDAKASHNVQ